MGRSRRLKARRITMAAGKMVSTKMKLSTTQMAMDSPNILSAGIFDAGL